MYIFLKERFSDFVNESNNRILANQHLICDKNRKFVSDKTNTEFSNFDFSFTHINPQAKFNNVINKVITKISNYINILNDIYKWNYSLYINVALVSFNINDEKFKKFIKSPSEEQMSYLGDFYKEYFEKSSEKQLNYTMLPIRVSMHYTDKNNSVYLSDYHFNNNDTDLNSSTKKSIVYTVLDDEKHYVNSYLKKQFKDDNFELDDYSYNNLNTIFNNVTVLPTMHISISNITRYLYSYDLDICDSNRKPRGMKYDINVLNSLTGAYGNILNNINTEFTESYLPNSLYISYGTPLDEIKTNDENINILDCRCFDVSQTSNIMKERQKYIGFNFSLNDNGVDFLKTLITNRLRQNVINNKGEVTRIIEKIVNDNALYVVNGCIIKD